MEKNELKNIYGGVTVTGTLINAITKGINTFLNLGRTVGSGIRRIYNGKVCPL